MADNTLVCDECGQNDFILKDGFYYCAECGMQTQQMRDVEIGSEGEEGRIYKRNVKIKTSIEKPQLTSWECFNYLLRGLVEELIELGAKRELKLVTLQLWAAYLRRTEAAFFDKKQPKLPKLGPRFCPRDVEILYNHKISRKRKKSTNASTCRSDNAKWRRQKRKLLQTEYESLFSQQSQQSSSQHSHSNSGISSSSGGSRRSIRLNFTDVTRKYLKKMMPKSHLSKHDIDNESELDCHNFNAIPTTVLPRRYTDQTMNRKTIYAILYLALNLVEDDIQLSDFLRFMREGHLSSSNISHMFPENVVEACEKLIHSRNFGSKRHVFLDSVMRMQAAILCRLIYIPTLKTPNIYKLAVRYLSDLCLPKGIEKFLERLINLCPPEMDFKLRSQYTPCYEGRAMAYIIFILKLLFGLDDIKEEAISQSAREINKKYEELHIIKKHGKLFVWDEWRNYIEMRNVILCQCHLPTSLVLKQFVDPSKYIDQINFEQNVTEEDLIRRKKTKLLNMERIFDSFQMKYQGTENSAPSESLKFPPSLTPNQYYFENILKDPPNSVYIPDFMHEDYTKADINAFVKPTKLKAIFKEYLVKLDVERIECNQNRKGLGIFRNFEDIERRRNHQEARLRKPVFDIDEEEWLYEITEAEKMGTSAAKKLKKEGKHSKTFEERLLEILANNQLYIQQKELKENNVENDTHSHTDESDTHSHTDESDTHSHTFENDTHTFTHTFKNNTQLHTAENNTNLYTVEKSTPLHPLKSFRPVLFEKNSLDVFSEANMLPLPENLIPEPRKNLEDDDLFADVSDDESSNDSSTEQTLDKLKLIISNLDYWILMGEIIHLPDINFLEVKNQFPSNFLWLLETCANLINIDCKHLYQELLTIENYFGYVLEPIKNVKNILTFKSPPDDKYLRGRVETYRSLW